MMRLLLWWLVAVGMALGTADGRWIEAPAAYAELNATPRLSLPAPTGPHQVGTTSLHLIHDSRIDPLAPTSRVRELMVRLWYPAAPSRQPAATYLTPGVASVSIETHNGSSFAPVPGIGLP